MSKIFGSIRLRLRETGQLREKTFFYFYFLEKRDKILGVHAKRLKCPKGTGELKV